MSRRILSIVFVALWGLSLSACDGGGGSVGPNAAGGDASVAGVGVSSADVGARAESGTCPTGTFLDVAAAAGPGGDYPAPFLEVSCTDDTMVVSSNGIPHYAYEPTTPNPLVAQDHQWEIPLAPEPAAQPTDIPLLGTVGFAVNGVPLYGPNEAANPHPYGDPIVNAVLDACLGHTGGGSDYHFHAFLVSCFFDSVLESDPSPILGYALDGFAVYGPLGCSDAACSEIIRFESGWEAINSGVVGCASSDECEPGFVCATARIDGEIVEACVSETYAWENSQYVGGGGDTVLDQCNGHFGPDGGYHYHATDTFPYLLGCFTGTATAAGAGGPVGVGPGGGQGGGPPGGGGNQGGGGPPQGTPCQADDDCAGVCVGGVACICHAPPMGPPTCVPACVTDFDCPPAPNGESLVCAPIGICVPAGAVP